ncbi:MAG: FAD-binding oxidoreductase [Alphaproteobacteria bacterium]|nr:FAD-binding oxidoreductase [Alphaproteobacteria bacterium]
MTECDFLVVGAGMAGVSAGFFLGRHGRVIVLEQESQPAYHATGRSAALYSETYGNAAVRAITTGGRAFFLSPPAGFADHPLLAARGVLVVGSAAQRASVERIHEEGRRLVASVRLVDQAEILRRVPVMRPEQALLGVDEPDAMDIDVHALHQGFLRGLRAAGGAVRTDAEVRALARRGELWEAETPAGRFAAPVLINAAGAWADRVASLAGIPPVGLSPKRRTAITFDPPAGQSIRAWPALIDADEQFYFKPDAGRLLASPADETPSEPCDAQPDELDIAICVDRLQAATSIEVRRIESRWAGLRTFAPDKTPVAGFEPGHAGFFWLAGQGGYGIQTAPAMGRLVAELARGLPMPADLEDLGARAAALSPARFR